MKVKPKCCGTKEMAALLDSSHMQGTLVKCWGGGRFHPDDQDVVSALKEVWVHSENGRDLCEHIVKKLLFDGDTT